MSPSPTLIGRLSEHAACRPEHCAVAASHVQLSYAELAAAVHAQAERLTAVRTDSVVGIECQDDVRHLILCLAVAARGATSCTIPTHETGEQRERARESCGVDVVLGDADAIDLGPSAPSAQSAPEALSAPAALSAALRPETDAELLFSTSGTTGEPKIVTLSSSSLVHQANRHIAGPSERFACIASIEHNFAKRHRLYCIAEGATNVFLGRGESLVDARNALEFTTLHLSAFQAQEVLALPGSDQLRPLRLKLGGSHVPTELRQKLRDRITPHLECGYGTTETGAIAFTDPEDSEDPAESVGRALTGIEICVHDDARSADEALPAGERGSIAIRCKGMFAGYRGRPELTRERLKGDWFHTGDVGYLDDAGRLHLCGRSDDMFVFNSMNIYPQDIEAQIRQHPQIADVVVIPKASPVHGDIPIALVVTEGAEDLDLRALKSFVRGQVGVRSPRQFSVVDRIPRNAAGKVLRAEARAMIGAPEGR